MVIKKVKEHNRKKTKEAKKLRLSRKKKPLKEPEVKALEAGRAEVIEELKRKKVECKERGRELPCTCNYFDFSCPIRCFSTLFTQNWLNWIP
ncbi:hypothetical protein Fmac_032696 [Flemingia macrophylla]|uniref:Uncharacterized protein n=1 Tax=Flemingia macrophylla TaxID=520843 RepID=A0ABD1L5M6_9FABA